MVDRKNILKRLNIISKYKMVIEKKTMSNKQLIEQNNNIDIDYMDYKFTTFKLGYNTKFPSNEWDKYYYEKDDNGDFVMIEAQDKDGNKIMIKNKVRVDYYVNESYWRKRSMAMIKEGSINYGIPCGLKNNIWVLDLDFYFKEGSKNPWIKEQCGFTKTFGCPDEYAKKHNIFMIKSTNGGRHMYFNFNPQMKTTSHRATNIDVRSNGGYIVAGGSQCNGKFYTYEGGAINDAPKEIIQWMLDNIYKKSGVSKSGKKLDYSKKVEDSDMKIIDPTTNQLMETTEHEIDLDVYQISIPDNLAERIIKNLPDNYFTEQNDWIIFTTAMKQIDKQKLWDKYSKKRGGDTYNYEKNLVHWQYVKTGQFFAINHILLNTKLKNARTCLDYYKMKPVQPNNNKPTDIIDREKLGIKPDGSKVLAYTEYENRVQAWQSDTGTGKTTEMKNYIKAKKKRMISIVSRITLGEEQVKVFNDDGIVTYWHKDISERNKKEGKYWGEWAGENIVITIDSLMKIKNFNVLGDYVIFLDEFNSLIKHLITSPTLSKDRMNIWNFFKYIIQQADKVVCCDADINEISLLFLKKAIRHNEELLYIKNKYKHNDGIPAEEIFSYHKFIKAVNGEDSWMICCDSKTQSEIIASIGDSTDYLLITSEGWWDSKNKIFIKGRKDLDSHKRVVFSPAVLYGLDSTMERPVFAYMREQTINPEEMVQQICRNRNITYLKFLFSMKMWKVYTYHNIEHTKTIINNRENYSAHTFHETNAETGAMVAVSEKDDLYNDLLAQYIYRDNCFATNKFAHFINILRNRGFKLNLKFQSTSEGQKLVDDRKAIREKKKNEFNEMAQEYLDRYINTDEDIKTLHSEIFPPSIIQLNEILKIEWKDIGKYTDFLLNPYDIQDHWNVSKIFFNDEDDLYQKFIDNDLYSGDFNPNKAKSYDSQILFMLKFRRMLNLENGKLYDGDGNYNENGLDCLGNIECNQGLPKDRIEKFIKEYKAVFRCSIKTEKWEKIDFTSAKECKKFLYKMYSGLCGDDLFDNKKTTRKGKSCVIYKLNEKQLDFHKELYWLRNNKPINNDVDWLSDDEE